MPGGLEVPAVGSKVTPNGIQATAVGASILPNRFDVAAIGFVMTAVGPFRVHITLHTGGNMKSTHFTVLDTGRRVQGFLDAQAAVLVSAVPATLRAQLDDAVSQIAAFQLEQGASTAAARGETGRQQLLRDHLYARFLYPVEGIAKKKLRGATEFASLIVRAAFRESNKLLAKATELADAAVAYEKVFVDNGLPADFIAQLRAGIAMVTASEAARSRQRSRRAAATSGLMAADKALRETIDSLNRVLKPALAMDPALLADWMASKRVRQLAVTPLPTGSLSSSPPAAAIAANRSPLGG
jgi:hypothetical protein